MNFNEERRKDIAKTIFIIVISSFNPEQRLFPLCFAKNTSGQVSVKWTETIEGLLRHLESDVIGETFGGDTVLYERTKTILCTYDCTSCEGEYDRFQRFFVRAFFLNIPRLVRSDKNITESILFGCFFWCFSVYTGIICRNKDLDLIGVPFWIRTSDPMKRWMIPKGILCLEYLRNAWDLKGPDLIFALLPTTLPLRANRDPNLTRVSRLN
jgi:hypothetical protein